MRRNRIPLARHWAPNVVETEAEAEAEAEAEVGECAGAEQAGSECCSQLANDPQSMCGCCVELSY